MMHVYRVETQDGEGPYRGSLADVAQCEREVPCHGPQSPTPNLEKEYLPRYTNDKQFGFISLSQLQRWFHGYFAPLASLGFGVGVYKVAKAKVSATPTQAVYDSSHAERKESLPVRKFINQEGN